MMMRYCIGSTGFACLQMFNFGRVAVWRLLPEAEAATLIRFGQKTKSTFGIRLRERLLLLLFASFEPALPEPEYQYYEYEHNQAERHQHNSHKYAGFDTIKVA